MNDHTTDRADRPPLSGLVLAGGYSTRFGERDKAVADLAGTPMIRHVVETLLEVTDQIVINCRTDQQEAIEDALTGEGDREWTLEYAFDSVPDQGPLAGIKAGLEVADREYAAVVACDMPFVSDTLLSYLAGRATGRDGAVVKLEDGWYQPTQAVYRCEPMHRACASALQSGNGRILAAIEAIDCAIVTERDLEDAPNPISLETFTSVDTQEALLEAEAKLDGEQT